MAIDTTDTRLLDALQKNSKLTTKALAYQLNLSNTAIYERIKKLDKQGYITNYVALLDKKKLEKSFIAFCHIKLVIHSQISIAEFERDVIKFPEVVECHHISGDYDYILKVLVKDTDAFRQFMVNKLTTIKHIGSTQSMLSINEVKHTTAIPIS